MIQFDLREKIFFVGGLVKTNTFPRLFKGPQGCQVPGVKKKGVLLGTKRSRFLWGQNPLERLRNDTVRDVFPMTQTWEWYIYQHE